MPNYFFDTYDRNIGQNKPILTPIVITLLSYNIPYMSQIFEKL